MKIIKIWKEEIKMNKNKVIITIGLIIVASVVGFTIGVNQPKEVCEECSNPLFDYEINEGIGKKYVYLNY